MATVYDVAKYIIEKYGSMSAMKLQKLVFYSQAMSLVWDDEELFESEFEAWAKGPVCRELYNEHKGLFLIEDSSIFDSPSRPFFPEDYVVGEHNIEVYQKETIDAVLNSVGDLNPYQLSEMTHSEDPWQEARGDCKSGEVCSRVIEKEKMVNYYERYW